MFKKIKSAFFGRIQRNNRLAGEVVAFYERVHYRRCQIPPDGIANEHYIILRYVLGGSLNLRT